MSVCNKYKCNGMPEPRSGWDLNPWHPWPCEMCDDSGVIVGIGNREILCDERCSKCGEPVHVVTIRKLV